MNYKFQSFVIVCLLLAGTVSSYSQDSLTNTKILVIVKEFSEKSIRFTFLDSLPQFVLNYIEKKNGEKFSVSRRKFNATDVGSGPRRRLSFVAKLNDDYILSYEHGGMGYHGH